MELSELIRGRGLKVTSSRMAVIAVLNEGRIAYAHAELEAVFSNMDRVTLYRVLKDFEDAGLVHKVVDMDGVTRYALCRHSCPGEQHEDRHVHFNCEACHKVYCLEKVDIPVVKMPKGFKTKGLQTMLHGLCAACSHAA